MPSSHPPNHPDRMSPGAGGDRDLRVATYNVYLGADLTVVFSVESDDDFAQRAALVRDQVAATDFTVRARAIAALLVRDSVDVVGLQEVARWTRTVEGVGGGEQQEVWLDYLEILLAALSSAGGEYDVHALTPSFRGSARVAGDAAMSVVGHNAILVRRGSGVVVDDERTGDFVCTLDVQTRMPGLVLNVARSWGWVDAKVAGRPFRFVNTHTEAWDEKVRDAQRDELLEAVGDPGVPVVLVGDLNSPPDRVGLPPGYVDAWARAGGDGPGTTCGQAADLANPASSLASRIDYVFVRGPEVTGCRVVGGRQEDRARRGGGEPLWPSDHAGVVADLRL